ncbi:MAG TPA: cytochrome c [Thermoanaerobaculia bacterium]|nr:cytochrome c [Thermoanaerobaculia bacterium]
MKVWIRAIGRGAALVLVGFTATVLAGCTRDGEADKARAHNLYQRNCAVCHGATGQGMRGLGKSLIANPFVHDRGETELVAFLKTGRNASHPLNETGVNMPPRGGNPSLTDEDLVAIARHLKGLEGNR